MPGALDGIKILELTRVGPGAFCTMMLADMGAEVLKIEPPPSGQLAGSGVKTCAARLRVISLRHQPSFFSPMVKPPVSGTRNRGRQ